MVSSFRIVYSLDSVSKLRYLWTNCLITSETFHSNKGFLDEEYIPTEKAQKAKLQGLIDSLDPDENQKFVLADFSLNKVGVPMQFVLV